MSLDKYCNACEAFPIVCDEAVFESYWQSADFVPFDPDRFDEESARAGRIDTGPVVVLSPIELRLEPFQERLLDQIRLSRARGHHRVADDDCGFCRDGRHCGQAD